MAEECKCLFATRPDVALCPQISDTGRLIAGAADCGRSMDEVPQLHVTEKWQEKMELWEAQELTRRMAKELPWIKELIVSRCSSQLCNHLGDLRRWVGTSCGECVEEKPEWEDSPWTIAGPILGVVGACALIFLLALCIAARNNITNWVQRQFNRIRSRPNNVAVVFLVPGAGMGNGGGGRAAIAMGTGGQGAIGFGGGGQAGMGAGGGGQWVLGAGGAVPLALGAGAVGGQLALPVAQQAFRGAQAKPNTPIPLPAARLPSPPLPPGTMQINTAGSSSAKCTIL